MFSLQDFFQSNPEDVDCLGSADSSGEQDKQLLKGEDAFFVDGVFDEDQRKTRRRIANRESARRTRQRKADMLKTLSTEVKKLSNRNILLQARAAAIAAEYSKAKMENDFLRQQVHELTMDATQQIQDLAPMLGLNQPDLYLHHPGAATASAPLDFYPACSLPQDAFPPSTNSLFPLYLPQVNITPKTSLPPLRSSPVPNTPHSQVDTPHTQSNNFSIMFPTAPQTVASNSLDDLSMPATVEDDDQWLWQ